MHPADILIKPLVTEKSTILSDQGKYVFQVRTDASKKEIARAIEWAFGVHVKSVNTARIKGKVKRFGRGISQRPNRKKAFVTLAPGETIPLFEGA